MANKIYIKNISRSQIKWRSALVAGLFIICLFIVVPAYANQGLDWLNAKANLGLPRLPDNGFSLGLDLQGGAHLIYQAKTDNIPDKDRADAVEGVRDVIERRVRGGLGVAEPLVQTTRVGNDYRIIVELPGVTDVNQAIKMIGETPVLEFKEENNVPERDLTVAETKQMNDFNLAAEKKAKEALRAVVTGQLDFASAALQYSDDIQSKNNSGDLGFISADVFPELYTWAKTRKDGETGDFLIKSAGGYNIVKRISQREGEKTVSSTNLSNLEYNVARILVATKQKTDIVPPKESWKTTGLSGKQLKRAEVTENTQTGQIQVALNFDDEGTKLFSEITMRNVNKPVAIFLDGQPISIPKVNEPILNGSAVISGGFTLLEAKQLSQRLNSGALPVPVEMLSQEKVDATLGADSLARSFKAGIAGLILVMVFMALYYRLPGLLSVFSLAMYAVLTLSIFKIIGVTLTLAGIAGFILTIGMAVDANVLVFERLKEELRWGKTLRNASEESFPRAWSSIWDSHMTSLISCFILIWFGSGFIQGFATVLAIGTLVNLFTAYTVTRTIMRLVFPLFKEEGNYLFLGYRRSSAAPVNQSK